MLAKVILQDVSESRGAFVTEDVEPSKEDVEHKEMMAELRGSFDDNVIKAVARMHQQLGHPSPDRLASELADLGYDKLHSACARRYRCEACLKRKRPMLFKPAKLSTAASFNDTIDIDVFHLLWKDEKKLILTIMDEYSRYEVDVVLGRGRVLRTRFRHLKTVGCHGQDHLAYYDLIWQVGTCRIFSRNGLAATTSSWTLFRRRPTTCLVFWSETTHCAGSRSTFTTIRCLRTT